LLAPKASPGGGRERGFRVLGLAFVAPSILNDSKGIVGSSGMVLMGKVSSATLFLSRGMTVVAQGDC
jgi:hypothetical protein